MRYEHFIRTLRQENVPDVPDHLWHRIDQTLQEKQEAHLRWSLFNIMPATVLAGAVAVFIGMVTLNYVHNTQVISYVNMLGSTEYIYEQCKFPG